MVAVAKTHTLVTLKRAIAGTLIFSAAVNLLGLAGPLFMMEVYDRVLPARSSASLLALGLIVIGAYAVLSMMDGLRGRVMVRLAALVDDTLAPRVFRVIAEASLKTRIGGDALKPAQEMGQIRAFLAGPGALALFELPWLPIYTAICFFLHPLMGFLAIGGMVLLVGLTALTDQLSRRFTKASAEALAVRNRFAEAVHQSAEAVAAMGMTRHAEQRWDQANARYVEQVMRTEDIALTISAVSKGLRYLLQSSALGLGAYLVINGDMSGGAIAAASILVTRAIAPAEQLISSWRNLLGARHAWGRLKEVFALFPEAKAKTSLPSPAQSFEVTGLTLCPPGERQPTVQNVGFQLTAGQGLAILGPSGSGKSSLVRGIVAAWPVLRGTVRLDGADIDQWPRADLGSHIGYMPQAVELFPGTVAENIARLDPSAQDEEIVAAARSAGAHDLIVKLPNGYQTPVGIGGAGLSAGQRQRIALARALFRQPFLVVLDEPNSHLDAEGEKALSRAVEGIRQRGGIVIVVAHRANILSVLDQVLILEEGKVKAFGPRDQLLKAGAARTATPTLRVVDGEGAAS